MSIGRVPGATGIQPSIVDAKGDLIVATAADSVSRLAVGSNDQVLTADSAQATGLKWAAIPASSGPAFRAYRNTSQQSFTASTWSKVQFNAESFDTDNCFDSTTNYRFTPNKAGYYQFNATLNVSRANSPTAAYMSFFKNGSQYSTCWGSNTTYGTSPIEHGSAIIYLNGSTDYVEVYVYDSDAAGRNVANSSYDSFFDGVWIRS